MKMQRLPIILASVLALCNMSSASSADHQVPVPDDVSAFTAQVPAHIAYSKTHVIDATADDHQVYASDDVSAFTAQVPAHIAYSKTHVIDAKKADRASQTAKGFTTVVYDTSQITYTVSDEVDHPDVAILASVKTVTEEPSRGITPI